MLTAALLEEKKRSMKKQKSNQKESQCSSTSISPTCSIEQHSVCLSRSPSPCRKPSFQMKNDSFKQTYKYIINSRTPSPVQNTKPFKSNSNINNNNNISNQLPMKINELKSPVTCPPPVRKKLPPTPVRASTIRDDYELKSLINQSMNQLIINNPRFYHQAFTITNNPINNCNDKNNDSDENEAFC